MHYPQNCGATIVKYILGLRYLMVRICKSLTIMTYVHPLRNVQIYFSREGSDQTLFHGHKDLLFSNDWDTVGKIKNQDICGSCTGV